MKIDKLVTSILTTILLLTSTAQSEAAGSKPILDVNCGKLLKLRDDKGDFLYFNPSVKITFWGAPFNATAYYATDKNEPLSEQGQQGLQGSVSSLRTKTIQLWEQSYGSSCSPFGPGFSVLNSNTDLANSLFGSTLTLRKSCSTLYSTPQTVYVP